jgi:hypothetical protein
MCSAGPKRASTLITSCRALARFLACVVAAIPQQCISESARVLWEPRIEPCSCRTTPSEKPVSSEARRPLFGVPLLQLFSLLKSRPFVLTLHIHGDVSLLQDHPQAWILELGLVSHRRTGAVERTNAARASRQSIPNVIRAAQFTDIVLRLQKRGSSREQQA